MKKAFLILIAVTSIASCKMHNSNVWTKQYEQEVYTEAYDGVGTIIKDPEQRRQFTLYTVARFKALLPYGLTSISSDSLEKLSTKIGKEYSETHNMDNFQATLKWSAALEATLRSEFLSSRSLAKWDKRKKIKFGNCIVSQLKTIYPDSLKMPIPDSIYTRIVAACK